MSPIVLSAATVAGALTLLAKATLLLVAAVVVAAALRRAPAGARHVVWLAVLASVLVLPMMARWAPLRLEVLPAQSALGGGVGEMSLAAPTGSMVAPGAGLARDAGTAKAPSASEAGDRAGAEAPRGNRQASLANAQAWWHEVSWWVIALGAWVGVAASLLVWLGYGAWSVRRIVREGTPLTGAGWTDALYEAADRLDLQETPRLLSSDRIEMPFACGLLRSTIVLPAGASAWNDDLRRTVLFHELAHVRRRDLVGHTVGRLACALYWFHPLVWTAAKRLRAESERACDDLVLSCGAKASDYAEHLLRMVIGVRRHGAPALALPMARRKEFEGRVVAILDPAIRRQAPSRWQAAGLVSVLAVLCFTIGAVAPARRTLETSRLTMADPIGRPPSDTASARNADVPRRVELPGSPSTTSGETPGQAGIDSRRTDTRTNARTETRVATRSETSTRGAAAPSADPDPRPSRSLERSIDDLARLFASRALSVFGQRPDTDRAGGVSARERTTLLLRLARTDDDASVRRTAVWALGQARDEHGSASAAEIDGTLAEVLRSDQNDDVREMAAWALAQLEGRTSVDALASAARRDKSASVRETAVWGLGTAGAESAMDVLEAALSDESSDVRATAIWAVGTMEPKQAPKGLVKALDDEREDVRLKAAWALGQILDPSTGDALAAAFKREQRSNVRSAELRALAFLGAESKGVLDAALASSDADLRARAVQILAGRGPGVWPWPWPWPRPRPSP